MTVSKLFALVLVVAVVAMLFVPRPVAPVENGRFECYIVTGENNGYAVLRSAPSYWYGFGVGVVYDGDSVTATARRGDWLLAETDRGDGWLRAEYCEEK